MHDTNNINTSKSPSRAARFVRHAIAYICMMEVDSDSDSHSHISQRNRQAKKGGGENKNCNKSKMIILLAM